METVLERGGLDNPGVQAAEHTCQSTEGMDYSCGKTDHCETLFFKPNYTHTQPLLPTEGLGSPAVLGWEQTEFHLSPAYPFLLLRNNS